jgi:bifunctional DNA-binding transcriptional regulator/antitoxin component of YhaV-PrlF toxin-antitoxin module
MEDIIRVRKRGLVTLPAGLLEKYGIEEGDTFRVLDLDGLLVLAPMVPMVPELAREIESLRLEAEVSIPELLEGLKEQRERCYWEHLADGGPA